MSKPRKPLTDDFDETAFFGEQDFDVEDFIDSMGEDTVRRKRKKRAAWQRLDEWRDQRHLRAQLDDWDWDLDNE